MILKYSGEDVKKEEGQVSIFLAGPTPRSKKIISWRNDAIKILNKFEYNGVVFIPEEREGKIRDDYINQADWEYEALSNSDLIIFWVPRSLPEMPAFTTNIEFGLWIRSGKILYGRPDNAKKIRYLDWLYNKLLFKKPINNLEDLLKECIANLNV